MLRKCLRTAGGHLHGAAYRRLLRRPPQKDAWARAPIAGKSILLRNKDSVIRKDGVRMSFNREHAKDRMMHDDLERELRWMGLQQAIPEKLG